MSDKPAETSYYLRLLSMYVDLGTETVLRVFTYHSPNKNPETFIKSKDKILLQLHSRRVLNKQEFKLLFTDETEGNVQNVKNTIDLESFDICLLITLSMNLFNEQQLRPPAKGWLNPPRNSDKSIAADLFRLRTKRNVIVGHHPKARMEKKRFDEEWAEISEILIRINRQFSPDSEKDIKERIDAYRVQKLDANVRRKYDPKLKEWLDNISRIKDMMESKDLMGFDYYFKDRCDRYEKYIALLIRSGRFVLSAFLEGKLKERNRDLRSVLDEHTSEESVESLGYKMSDFNQICSHEEGEKNILSTWDVSKIVMFIDVKFGNAIEGVIRRAVRGISTAYRNYADAATVALDGSKFEELSIELKTNIRIVANYLDQEQEDRCREIMNECTESEVEESFKCYIDVLETQSSPKKTFREKFQETLQRTKDCLKDMVAKGKNFKEQHGLDLRMNTIGDDAEKKELAEEIVMEIWQTALKILKSPAEVGAKYEELANSFPRVVEIVRMIIDEVKNVTDVRKLSVEKACIILKVTCGTPQAILDVICYFESRTFQDRLSIMAKELGYHFNTTFVFDAIMPIDSLWRIYQQRKSRVLNENEELDDDQDEKDLPEYQENTDTNQLSLTSLADASLELLVVAFDFGTTFSGYAFSFRNEPLKIHTNDAWNAGSSRLLSLKTSTSILLDPEENFHSFGFAAENQYKMLFDSNEHHSWLFFRRFKMLLYNKKKLSKQTTVKDITGKRRMFAIDIFSMSIRYLRDHFLRQLQKQNSVVKESDIKYVITIPAIWDENGKQFMRKAALQADIDNARLTLALEPETASIWCQNVDAETNLFRSGSQYIVIDIGGGTADITAHKRNDNGTLTELFKASGGPWGGLCIDDNYLKFLTQLFGEKVMSRFKNEHIEDYWDMLREFETHKRSVESSDFPDQKYLTCRLSAALNTISKEENGKKLDELIRLSPFSSDVVEKRDKIRISIEIVRKWFDEPVDNIIHHVEGILSKPEVQKVTSVLLVGGMAESHYVQEKIKCAFSLKAFIAPKEASLAVLKGAVVFGHKPTFISARVMRYSYGVEMFGKFKDKKHDSSVRVKVRGKTYRDHVFNVFVKAGDTVQVGQKISKTCAPINEESSVYPIYRSSSNSPEYTSEPDSELVGVLTLRHNEQGAFNSIKVEITMTFGDTELTVRAKEKDTGNECISSFNCLLD